MSSTGYIAMNKTKFIISWTGIGKLWLTGQISLTVSFVKKILLNHSHNQLFTYCLWLSRPYKNLERVVIKFHWFVCLQNMHLVKGIFVSFSSSWLMRLRLSQTQTHSCTWGKAHSVKYQSQLYRVKLISVS